MRHLQVILNADLNTLRCFAGSGVRVGVVSSSPDELAFHSRYCRMSRLIASPRTDPEAALRDLLALGRQVPGRPVLLCDNEPMLLLMSRHRSDLAEHFQMLLPSEQITEDACNKTQFLHLAGRMNWPVPRAVASAELSSADDILERLSLPVMFKPDSHVGWYQLPVVRGEAAGPLKALRAVTGQDVRRLYAAMCVQAPSFVVQEYIPGGDDMIFSFHGYFDRRSNPVAWFIGRKIRTYPPVAGVSTCLRLTREPALAEMSVDLLRQLKFVGPVKIDYKLDETRGRFFMMEINPRLNLWSYLGAASGINLALLAYQDAIGAPLCRPTSYSTRHRWLSAGDDLRTFLRFYRPSGELGWRSYLASLLPPKRYNVFAWRDPRPMLICAARFWAGALRKLRRRSRATQAAITEPQQAGVS